MPNSRVLYVEDDFTTNVDTCDFLRNNGLRIVSVYCAQAAFEIIDRHERLRGLVTDVDLGPGPDGFAIARRSRAMCSALPVVFVSGTARDRFVAEGVEGSVFISKPFHPRQVLEALVGGVHREAA